MCGPYQVYPFWFLDKLDVLQEPAKTTTTKKKPKSKEAQELVIIYQELENYKTY